METQPIQLASLLASAFAFGPVFAAAAEPREGTSPGESQLEPQIAVLAQPVVSESGEDNQLFFRTGDAAQQAMQDMRDKLTDPARRQALRAELIGKLKEQHDDIDEHLDIDAATKAKLIELLADDQLTRLESTSAMQLGHEHSIQAEADAQTRKLETMRALIGQGGLEKYQLYVETVWERKQVERLDALLAPPDKLQPEQRRKLVELFFEHNANARNRQMSSSIAPPFPMIGDMPSPAEMQRHSQLLTIEANQESWRRAQEENPALRERAAQFLSPSQLAAFKRMHEEELTRLRAWIERARLQAGLSAEIPEASERLVARPVPRTPITGEATFELSVSVNGRTPVVQTHTGANAHPILFDAGDGLWIEATPTLYEDHWLDVELKFYERVGDGKRRIDKGSRFGTLARLPDGTPGHGGMSTDVVTGSKGYAVKTQVKVVAP